MLHYVLILLLVLFEFQSSYILIMGSSFSFSKSDGMYSCADPRRISKKIDDILYENALLPPDTNDFDLETINLVPTMELKKIHFIGNSTRQNNSDKVNVPVAVLFIRPKNKQQNTEKTIVFAHGNAMDVLYIADMLQYLADFLNVNVVCFDYPGYSYARDIEKSEEGCYDAMECTMNYLMNDLKIPKENLCLVGQSLGTGIVVHYAAKFQWQYPIMLISPYKSIVKVLMDTSLTRPIDRFRTLDKIGKLVCSVQIIHGVDDSLIKISHGKYLYNHLKNKSFEPFWLDGYGHNDILGEIFRDKKYWTKLLTRKV